MRIDPPPANPPPIPAAAIRPRPPAINPPVVSPAPVASARAPVAMPKAQIATPPATAASALANTAPPAAVQAAPPATTPAPAPAAPPAASSEPALPSIYDLPIALRRDMPQMTVSMQVYSVDPARRFIVVDGERKKEGDAIHDVAVREIRANGVVLEYRGQRFVFPRPGS
jgi:general secretion pathway protein B